jgi:hypothetical protein
VAHYLGTGEGLAYSIVFSEMESGKEWDWNLMQLVERR